jgi:hypothetical protein
LARDDNGSYGCLISKSEVVDGRDFHPVQAGLQDRGLRQRKGLSSTAFVFLLLGLWFGGEISGGIAGAVVSFLLNPHVSPSPLLMYAGGIAGALLGSTLAFKIVDWQQPAELWSPPALEEEGAGGPPSPRPTVEPIADDHIQERPR